MTFRSFMLSEKLADLMIIRIFTLVAQESFFFSQSISFFHTQPFIFTRHFRNIYSASIRIEQSTMTFVKSKKIAI